MSVKDDPARYSPASKDRLGVLFVVGQLKGGGLERQLRYLAPRLKSPGSQIVVWNYHSLDRYAKEIEEQGVPVVGYPPEWSSFRKLACLGRFVRRTRPRVVHSYSFFTNFPAFIATLGGNATPIGAIRSNFIDERRRAGFVLGRFSARWPRFHISNSQAAKDNAMLFPAAFRPSRIEVVRNGLDLACFAPTDSPIVEPAILSVGSLIPDKRWDRLLEATAVLKKRGLAFGVRLVGDGPLKNQLLARTRELGIEDRVHLLGERRDIPELLSSSSFLVHTSNREGCPNVVMEAMACGRGVIATDAGDVPSLIDHGITGFVVSRGDDTGLVGCMADLIRQPERCRGMGRAGRVKAERDFSIERLVCGTLEAYRAAGCTGGNL